MRDKDLVVGLACGLVIGAVAGMAAGLLLAPASGSETRRRLIYERDNTLEAARGKTRRVAAWLNREEPVEEVEADEDETEQVVGFIGA